MPTYEYFCTRCGSIFEVLISSADKDKVICPVCGEGKLKEIYGANIRTGKDSCSTTRFGFG